MPFFRRSAVIIPGGRNSPSGLALTAAPQSRLSSIQFHEAHSLGADWGGPLQPFFQTSLREGLGVQQCCFSPTLRHSLYFKRVLRFNLVSCPILFFSRPGSNNLANLPKPQASLLAPCYCFAQRTTLLSRISPSHCDVCCWQISQVRPATDECQHLNIWTFEHLTA